MNNFQAVFESIRDSVSVIVRELTRHQSDALIVAVANNDTAAARTYLQTTSHDVNTTYDIGGLRNVTALCWAVMTHSAPLVELLLAHGASPDILLSDTVAGTEYAVSMLCYPTDTAILTRLLDAGADINAGKISVLLPAMINNNIRLMRFLLDANANPNGTSEFSCLHYAAAHCSTVIVGCLLQAGADPNLVSEAWSCHPLAAAASCERVDNAHLLLTANADPCVTTASGETVLMLACAKRSSEFVQLLLDAGITVSPGELSVAADCGNTQILETLLVHARGDEQNESRALTIAAAKGDVDIVELLLLQASRENMQVALCVASAVGAERVIASLLNANADVNGVDPRNKVSPLMSASHFSQEHVVGALLALNADVHYHKRIEGALYDYNINALSIAGSSEIRELLRSEGATEPPYTTSHLATIAGVALLSLATTFALVSRFLSRPEK